MKRVFKLALDIVLLLLVLTLFDKQFLGLSYHIVAGLIMVALVLLHIGLNMRTVIGLGRNFAKAPPVWKCTLIVDIMLMLCFMGLLVTGLLCIPSIAKVLGYVPTVPKLSHIVLGAISVPLLGVHIGLHIPFRRLKVALALLLTLVLVAGGIMGLKNTRELMWLKIPFSAMAPKEEEAHSDEGEVRGSGGGKGLGKGQGQGQGRGRTPMSAAQKGVMALYFLCMIGSLSMLGYWGAQGLKLVNRGSRGE